MSDQQEFERRPKERMEHVLEKAAWTVITALGSIAFALAIAWTRHVDSALAQQVELNREREKRLSTVEAIVPDVKDALRRIEQNQEDLARELRGHVINGNRVNGNR